MYDCNAKFLLALKYVATFEENKMSKIRIIEKKEGQGAVINVVKSFIEKANLKGRNFRGN